MEATHAKAGTAPTRSRTAPNRASSADMAIREGLEQARDLVEDLRDRAEMAFHERPYLLPVATGVLGFGIGVLVGSKLSRLILFAAGGALLNDAVRARVMKVSRDVIDNVGDKLASPDGEDVELSDH